MAKKKQTYNILRNEQLAHLEKEHNAIYFRYAKGLNNSSQEEQYKFLFPLDKNECSHVLVGNHLYKLNKEESVLEIKNFCEQNTKDSLFEKLMN